MSITEPYGTIGIAYDKSETKLLWMYLEFGPL